MVWLLEWKMLHRTYVCVAKAKANNYKCVVLLMMIKPPSKYKLHIIQMGELNNSGSCSSAQMNEIRIEQRERVESATVSDFALNCCYGAFDLMLMIQSILHVSPAVLCSLDLFTRIQTCNSHIFSPFDTQKPIFSIFSYAHYCRKCSLS